MLSVSFNTPVNPNVAQNYSFVGVNNDQGVPLFAQAVFQVNGLNGFVPVTTTTALTGSFNSFQTVTSTVVASVTASNGNVINLSALTFPANFTFNIPFIGIKLTNGSGLAYNS